jgi:hypothetical protein
MRPALLLVMAAASAMAMSQTDYDKKVQDLVKKIAKEEKEWKDSDSSEHKLAHKINKNKSELLKLQKDSKWDETKKNNKDIEKSAKEALKSDVETCSGIKDKKAKDECHDGHHTLMGECDKVKDGKAKDACKKLKVNVSIFLAAKFHH